MNPQCFKGVDNLLHKLKIKLREEFLDSNIKPIYHKMGCRYTGIALLGFVNLNVD